MPSSDICVKFPDLLLKALFSVVLVVSSPPLFFRIEAKNGDLSFDLVHRDSPKSPFYDPLLNSFDRKKNAFQRSKDRIHYFASTNVLPDGGEYLMKISYGTPSVETLAIVDTGSDLSWTQCLPCKHCYKEKFQPFNPKNSSTFQFIPCKTKECQDSSLTHCKARSQNCLYEITYGDLSFSHGELATETITLDSNVSFPGFVFGCGHDNGGIFPFQGSGLVGFGFNNQSLVTQLNSSIQGKFSYCFGPITEVSKSGKLILGKTDVFSSAGVVSTPMVLKSFYTMTLEGISVYNKSLAISSTNIIIDSGTTYTFLPTSLYKEFESIIKQNIKSHKFVPDPQNIFGLCYSSLEGVHIPNVTIHFKGADLKLNPINTFVSTSNSSFCLAFVPNDDINILGNTQQINFWVGYDLEKKSVSFKPADCIQE